MERKLRIFTPIIEDSGVGFYRIAQPTKNFAEKEKAYVMSSPFTGQMQIKDIDGGLLEQGAKWADIIFMNTAKDARMLVTIMALRDWQRKKLVIDVDDNLINLDPDHPSYKAYTDPQKNPSLFAQKSLMYADMVVVSTEYLKGFYGDLNKNIYVNPNSIDFKIWKHKKKKHKKLRIGWAGAAGHKENLEMVAKPLQKIKKKYKNVDIVTFGEIPRGFKSDWHKKWVPFAKYSKTYANLGFDIIIAPLRDSRYNRAKSNLRLIEAGALKIPAVASPVEPYKNFPCLYAKEEEDWFNQLEKLIKDRTLRNKIGRMAYQEVKEKYEINKNSEALLKKFQQLTKRKWIDRRPLIPRYSEVRQ